MNETDRPLTMNRGARHTREQYPEPGTTPLQHARHTMAVYAEVPGDREVLTATGNVYGDGVRTGLDFADLRELVRLAEIGSVFDRPGGTA